MGASEGVLDDVLTAEEIDTVIMALVEGLEGRATRDELKAAVRWARKARIDRYLVDLVLDNKLVMRLGDGGGVRFVARGCASAPTG